MTDPKALSTIIRNSIVGHGDEPPDQLLAHPLNFRRHPGEQMDALRGSLRELGWIRTVLVNKRTGHVLDGHARVEEALRQGLATVPVTWVDLDENQERLALALLDRISELAAQDEEVLGELLAHTTTEDSDVQAVLDGLAGDEESAAAAAREDGQGSYQEQYGVIVLCGNETEQKSVYETLTAQGLTCKVVVT